MNLNDYQKEAISTDVFDVEGVVPASNPAHINKVLGLSGEAGEVAEKYKKLFRDKDGKLTPQDTEEIAKELGDVLWYVSLLAHYLGFTLDEVAQMNVRKLKSRKDRDALKGSGDNR